ncbi:hypothetical protein HDK64DRAFT_262199 [Phyllosticta capitalensis]
MPLGRCIVTWILSHGISSRRVEHMGICSPPMPSPVVYIDAGRLAHLGVLWLAATWPKHYHDGSKASSKCNVRVTDSKTE